MMKTQSLYQETANVAYGGCSSSSPSPFGSMITMIRDPNSISHHERVALALRVIGIEEKYSSVDDKYLHMYGVDTESSRATPLKLWHHDGEDLTE